MQSHDKRLFLHKSLVSGRGDVCIERYWHGSQVNPGEFFHSFGCPALDLMGYGRISELLDDIQRTLDVRFSFADEIVNFFLQERGRVFACANSKGLFFEAVA